MLHNAAPPLDYHIVSANKTIMQAFAYCPQNRGGNPGIEYLIDTPRFIIRNTTADISNWGQRKTAHYCWNSQGEWVACTQFDYYRWVLCTAPPNCCYFSSHSALHTHTHTLSLTLYLPPSSIAGGGGSAMATAQLQKAVLGSTTVVCPLSLIMGSDTGKPTMPLMTPNFQKRVNSHHC